MPELPDVETYRRQLEAKALGRTIRAVHVPAPGLLVETTPQGLGMALAGRRFIRTTRHGKYLFATLDSGRCLVLHFGMTGRLGCGPRGDPWPCYTRLAIVFVDGSHLAYVAPRKLGRIALADTPPAYVAAHRLGPDALALDQDSLARLAQGRRGSVKSWLMDQTALAGIGNVYSDEILYRARFDPRRKVSSLASRDLARLWRALRYVLERAVRAGADPRRMPRSWLLRHRKRNAHCPRCGAELAQWRIGGRNARYCPRCQR